MIEWRKPTAKIGRSQKPSQPNMPFPVGLPPLPGYNWKSNRNVNGGKLLIWPDFDPVADFAPWSIDGWLHGLVRYQAAGTVDERISAVAREIGHRAAHSMTLRTGVHHLPDGYERAVRDFTYISLGYPVPTANKRPLNLRCLNTARVRRRETKAERQRIAAHISEGAGGQLEIVL